MRPHAIPVPSIVTNRDLRHSWKTLAGKAGVSKEIRDRIQNHALHDVSSKNYDRWNYLPESAKAWNGGTNSSGPSSPKFKVKELLI